MKRFLLYAMFCFSSFDAVAQVVKIEMYDLVRKLLDDSTGYENVGEWDVGEPKKYPIQWKNVEMSDDTAINFFRLGIADLTIRGKTYMTSGQKAKWNIMLKGPRMGYTSFSILSSNSSELHPKFTIDSLFGNKPFTSELIKKCDGNSVAGFYFYSLKLPKKDLAYLKLSWLTVNGTTAIRVDCFDAYTRYTAKLDCPK